MQDNEELAEEIALSISQRWEKFYKGRSAIFKASGEPIPEFEIPWPTCPICTKSLDHFEMIWECHVCEVTWDHDGSNPREWED